MPLASAAPASNVASPTEAVLAALNAPSPFDPANFGSLNMPDDFASFLAGFNAAAAMAAGANGGSGPVVGSAGSGADSTVATSKDAIDVNTAAALAGIGGKWMNWSNSQIDSPEQDATLISTVLRTSGESPEIFNAPTPSAHPHASSASAGSAGSGSGSHPKSTATSRQGSLSKASPTSTAERNAAVPTRESSVTHFDSFGDIEGASPEDLAARDPLATHLWRLYAKAKVGLPNGARMENITWRMMSLKLNKHKVAGGSSNPAATPSSTSAAGPDTFQAPGAAGISANAPAEQTETAASEIGSAVSSAVQSHKSVKELAAEETDRGRRGRASAPNSASPVER